MNLIHFLILILVCELVFVSLINSCPKKLELEIILPKEKEIRLFSKSSEGLPKHFSILINAIGNHECPPWADPTIVGPNGELGPLQILPILVKDVNDFLINEIGYKKQHLYTLNDRLDLLKSIEIFMHYYYKYTWGTTEDNVETIARRWFGGPKGNICDYTLEYWYAIKSLMEEELGHEL